MSAEVRALPEEIRQNMNTYTVTDGEVEVHLYADEALAAVDNDGGVTVPGPDSDDVVVGPNWQRVVNDNLIGTISELLTDQNNRERLEAEAAANQAIVDQHEVDEQVDEEPAAADNDLENGNENAGEEPANEAVDPDGNDLPPPPEELEEENEPEAPLPDAEVHGDVTVTETPPWWVPVGIAAAVILAVLAGIVGMTMPTGKVSAEALAAELDTTLSWTGCRQWSDEGDLVHCRDGEGAVHLLSVVGSVTSHDQADSCFGGMMSQQTIDATDDCPGARRIE